MNYSEQLLSGISRFNTDLIAADVGCDSEKFKTIMHLMLNGKAPIPQRAAWVMSAVTDQYLFLIEPYINQIIEFLPDYKHPGITRNVLRVLAQIHIPPELQGTMFEYCYKSLKEKDVPIAIRTLSMEILCNISENEPDLKSELILLIESQLNGCSAGVENRARKLLKKLRKN
jgi:hypothetical protein